MSSVHGGNQGFDITLMAATTTLATSTGQYRAVYMAGDNTVGIINTLTAIPLYIGITQDYAKAVNGAIRVRVGGISKAILSGGTTTTDAVTGSFLTFDVGTTTCWGTFKLQARTQADPTAGSVFIAGKALMATAGTDSVYDILMLQGFSTAITTTVGS